MNEQLVQAICDRLEEGFSERVIRQQVLEAGHPEEVFNAAYQKAKNTVGKSKNTEPVGSKKVLFLLLALIMLLAIVGGALMALFPQLSFELPISY